MIKDARNRFRVSKENQAIKDKIIKDIGIRKRRKKKPVRVVNFYDKNYIKYERNGDWNNKEYVDKIKPYLKDIINNLNKSDTWKTQLAIAINFMASKDTEEERVMHSKGDNIEIMIINERDEVIEEPFESLRSRYQIFLKESIEGSDFVFDYVSLLYYKCLKLNMNCSGS